MDRRAITLPIEDFGCTGREANTIERALASVPGVLRVYLNAATEMTYIQYDAECCDVAALQEAIAPTGFHAGTPIVL